MMANDELGVLTPRRWLAVLRQTQGETYLQVRDLVLDRPALAPVWKREAERPGWSHGCLGDILDGWSTQRALFEQVDAEVAAADFEAAKKKRGGASAIWRALGELGGRHGEALLPRLWEQLWKRANLDHPEVSIAYLHMLAEIPHPSSEGPLVYAVEMARDPGLQDLCLRVLTSIPQPGLQGRAEALQGRHRNIAGLFQRAARAKS